MLFGPVLKEIQAPQGIPTLDGEHSHGPGNIGQGFPKIWWGTTIFSLDSDLWCLTDPDPPVGVQIPTEQGPSGSVDP